MSDVKNPQTPEEGADEGRRTFLKLAAGAVGACYAGLVGYPVYRYIASPVEDAAAVGAVTEVTLPPEAAATPKNAAFMFKFGTKPAMLIHHDDDTWTALTAVCTHLGCTAGYEPSKKQIFCPCHGGTYDAHTGANVAGPPPKPLDKYKVAMTSGKVVVSRA